MIKVVVIVRLRMLKIFQTLQGVKEKVMQNKSWLITNVLVFEAYCCQRESDATVTQNGSWLIATNVLVLDIHCKEYQIPKNATFIVYPWMWISQGYHWTPTKIFHTQV